jgi:hypothetical protein
VIVMDIDLEQARRRAKELLRAARRGEAQLRDDREPRLADAQRVVAQALGFPSWPALVGHVDASRGDRRSAAASSSPLRSAAATTSPSACSPTTRRSPARGSTSRSCSAMRRPSSPRWTPTPS